MTKATGPSESKSTVTDAAPEVDGVRLSVPASDGIVTGTNNADTMLPGYTDADGDQIDGNDANLPGEEGDDDIILALGGDDVVDAGMGDDEVYGGSGNDSIDGSDGDDLIYGGNGGAAVETVRESFEWDLAPDPNGSGAIDDHDDLSGGFTQNTGNANVTFSVLTPTAGDYTTFADNDQNVDGIATDGGPADENSSLASGLGGKGESVDYELQFDQDVTNVSFRVNDIDNDGLVRILAYDLEGQPIEVTLTGGSGLTLLDTDGVAGADTGKSNGGNDPDASARFSMLVEIAGPVGRIVIEHDQDGNYDSGVNVTDVYFDVVDQSTATDGDDTLNGGDGDDTILGEDGDDSITGGDGSDSVEGGDGDDVIDTGRDGIVLPDLGFPGYLAVPPIPADGDPDDDRDYVDGGAGDDAISTGDDADTVFGGSGDDTIETGLDADLIDAGDGDDLVIGSEGSDTISGGDGADTIYGGLDPAFPDAFNIVNGPEGDPEPDNGRDLIDGGDGDDVIFGQDDDDTIFGGAGDDLIDGGIDADVIDGGTGSDTITGGQGSDTLTGGEGVDTLLGGADEDLFLIGSVNEGNNDSIDGGSTGVDDDTLDVFGTVDVDYRFVDLVTDSDGNGFDGTIEYLNGGGVSGRTQFTNIENLDGIICFTPGTLIATPKGERRIEDLQTGDRIITRDNGIQRVCWFGQRSLTGGELRRAEHLRPIHIRAGALGAGLPERDMMVSPNHRVLVANDKTALYFEEREVLVAAKHLTGLDGVAQTDVSHVTYVHMMFEQHEVVLSDGAWTESFQPGDHSLEGIGNAQRTEIFELFPELATAEGVENYHAARRSLKKHEADVLFL